MHWVTYSHAHGFSTGMLSNRSVEEMMIRVIVVVITVYSQCLYQINMAFHWTCINYPHTEEQWNSLLKTKLFSSNKFKVFSCLKAVSSTCKSHQTEEPIETLQI